MLSVLSHRTRNAACTRRRQTRARPAPVSNRARFGHHYPTNPRPPLSAECANTWRQTLGCDNISPACVGLGRVRNPQAWDTPRGSNRSDATSSDIGDDVPDGFAAATTATSSEPWAEEEDAVLREGVLKFGVENWMSVARHLVPPITGGPLKRGADDCRDRWEMVVRHTSVKGPWLPEEDELLRRLVGEIGPKRWALIASHIPGRAGKQCRERWLNHLDTNVRKGEWTNEEDELLLETQRRVGNKWSEIARLLPGRAENAVKNRFNSLIAKAMPYGLGMSSGGDVPDAGAEYMTARAPAETEQQHQVVKPEPGLDEDEAEAEEAAIEGKKGKELLQYMFAKIGNNPHGPRIPQSPRTSCESWDLDLTDDPDGAGSAADTSIEDSATATAGATSALRGAAASKPSDRFRINLQLAEDSSSDDDDDDAVDRMDSPTMDRTTLTQMSVAKRAYDREVERHELFRATAISSTEWRELEDRARVAAAIPAPEPDSDAAPSLELASEEPSATAPASNDDSGSGGVMLRLSRPKVCESPGARGRRRGTGGGGGFDRSTDPSHDADQMRLSETLTSLSLEDTSWLADAALGLASTKSARGGGAMSASFRASVASASGSVDWGRTADRSAAPGSSSAQNGRGAGASATAATVKGGHAAANSSGISGSSGGAAPNVRERTFGRAGQSIQVCVTGRRCHASLLTPAGCISLVLRVRSW